MWTSLTVFTSFSDLHHKFIQLTSISGLTALWATAGEHPWGTSLVTRQMILIFKHRVLLHVVAYIHFFSCAKAMFLLGSDGRLLQMQDCFPVIVHRVHRNPLTLCLLIHIPQSSARNSKTLHSLWYHIWSSPRSLFLLFGWIHTHMHDWSWCWEWLINETPLK